MQGSITDFQQILTAGIWCGLFAMAMSVVFATPLRGMPITFFCGFVARCSRDSLTGWGASLILATMFAGALAVLVAAVLVRRRPGFSPFVVFCSLLPLCAAVPFFSAIVEFLTISSRSAEAGNSAPVALVSDLSKVFTTTLALAAGAWMGWGIAHVLDRKPQPEVE